MEYTLVTGGAGFIGANYLNHIVPQSNYHYINLDALTYAANLDHIQVSHLSNYTFIKGDIRNKCVLLH